MPHPRTQEAIDHLKRGTAALRNRDLTSARDSFRLALDADPTNANVWYLLGVVTLQGGDAAAAVQHFRACLARRVDHADAANALGLALRRLQRHDEAAAAFRAALGVRPGYVDAAYNLALTCETLGDSDQAEALYRQNLERGPHGASATNLGHLLCRRGDRIGALPLFASAQSLAPKSPPANINLARVLIDLGRAEEATGYGRIATEEAPQNAAAWLALGVAERMRRDHDGAIAALRRALALAPGDGRILAELATALLDAGSVAEARDLLSRAVVPGEDAERLRWAVALSLPSIYASDAEVDEERRRFARGLEDIAAGLELDSDPHRRQTYAAVCSADVFLLHYQPRNNTDLQCRFGGLVDRVLRAAVPELMESLPRRRRDGRRVRVGIVSSHLMNHTVSRYFRRMITGLDPERFDLAAWYGGNVDDASTRQIAAHASRFERFGDDLVAAATRIRGAELDVLVYPEVGMDPRHHVLGAWRLAPVQCALYGHPVTSGLPNMDYFLSGTEIEPADAIDHYREKLVLLPGLGAAPEQPPAPARSGATDGSLGTSLLLCLQNHLKLPVEFDAVLADIAAATGMRVGFFIRNIGVGRLFRQRIESAFSRRGLDPARALVFLAKKSHPEFLEIVRSATLILDTPWFSGGATSLDAFSVGAPVLTWEGALARGRQTAAMLRLMGVSDLIAADGPEYAAKAVALCSDPASRAELRERIAAKSNVLFEGAGVIAAFSNFLESIA